jgi:hypothetical protein
MSSNPIPSNPTGRVNYIEYEPRSASNRRRGLLRIAAVVCSIVLSAGYVVYYRTRAAPPPSRIRVLTRVGPIAGPTGKFLTSAAPVPVSQPTTRILTEDQRLLLMSSSKSGAIIPPQTFATTRPSTQP